MLWPLLFGLYALGTTGLLFVVYRRKHRDDEVLERFEAMAQSSAPAVDRVKAAAKLLKVRQAEIPWWERSLSAVGAIAFFSMLTATTVQTFRAGIEAARADRLRAGVERLESRQADLRSTLNDVAVVLVGESRRGNRLAPGGKRLLRQRLELLLEQKDLGRKERIEGFEIGFALDDFDTALAVIAEDVSALDEALAADKVTLAQFYYLEGAESTARRLLERVEEQLSTLPPEWRARVAVLNAALEPERRERSAQEIAAALDLPREEALRRLGRELRHLESAVADVRPASASSPR